MTPPRQSFDPEIFLLRRGLKSLVKKEHVRRADLDAYLARLTREGLSAGADDSLAYGRGSTDALDYGRADGEFCTVFIARDPDTLAAARRWQAHQMETGPAAAALAVQARAELGRLLGYPPCCVEAYTHGLNAPHFPRGPQGFHLDAYHRTTGAFHWLLNRLALGDAYLSHAPCTYDCAPSVALAQVVFDEVRRLDPGLAEGHAALLQRPLWFWSADTWIALEGSRDGARVAYTDAVFSPSPAVPAERWAAVGARVRDHQEVRVTAAGLRFGTTLVAELEPLAPPLWFPWDGRAPLWRTRPRVAFVELRSTEDGYFDNDLAVLCGDLLRLGVPADLYRATVAHRDTPEVRQRLLRIVEKIQRSGAVTAVLDRHLSPWLAEALHAAGMQVALLRVGGHEAPGVVDHVLLDRSRRELDPPPRVAMLRALLASVRSACAVAPPSAENPLLPPPDAVLDASLDEAPYHPVIEGVDVPGVPRPSPRRWYFHGNEGCPFSRPYSFEAETPMDAATRAVVTLRGCNFCDLGGDHQRVIPPPELGRRMAREMAYVVRQGAVRELIVGDTFPHGYLDTLIETLAAEHVRGVELLVQTRPDWLLRAHQQLLRVTPRLARMDSRLALYLVGFENFSQPELDRLDKGLTVAQNVAAIALIRELDRTHGEVFSGTRHRAHGFLLFNPWTTPDDLLANAAVMEETRFDTLRPYALLTRLRLYPGLPLYHRAKREGLLIATYDDDARSSSRRIGYADEFPWRAQHPAVDRVFALVAAAHDGVDDAAHPALLRAAVHFATNAAHQATDDETLCAAFLAGPARALARPVPPPPAAGPDDRRPPPATEALQAMERAAWALLSAGRLAEAERVVAGMVALDPGSPGVRKVQQQVAAQGLFAQAIERFLARDWDAAVALYAQITASTPDAAEAHRGLARAHWSAGRRDLALRSWETFLRLRGLRAAEAGEHPH